MMQVPITVMCCWGSTEKSAEEKKSFPRPAVRLQPLTFKALRKGPVEWQERFDHGLCKNATLKFDTPYSTGSLEPIVGTIRQILSHIIRSTSQTYLLESIQKAEKTSTFSIAQKRVFAILCKTVARPKW
jgi:hypothetical protein